MSGTDITPPTQKGVTYRGLTEIVGLSIAAVVIFGVIIGELVRNVPVQSALIDTLIIIVGVIVARSVKGAQDRDASAANIDAAAHAATKVATEVKQTIDEHKAQIAAFAQIIAQLAPATAPVLAQLGFPSSPPGSISAPPPPPPVKPG